MLEAFYATERGSLEDATINGDFDLHPDLVWLDLIAPSQEEQQWILDAYGQNMPTLKSLEDISSSARFYRDDDGILHISTYFLTKNKNFQVDGEAEENSSILATVQTVAFILHKERLFTLRGEKLVAFRAFRARAAMTMKLITKIRPGFYWACWKPSWMSLRISWKISTRTWKSIPQKC